MKIDYPAADLRPVYDALLQLADIQTRLVNGEHSASDRAAMVEQLNALKAEISRLKGA